MKIVTLPPWPLEVVLVTIEGQDHLIPHPDTQLEARSILRDEQSAKTFKTFHAYTIRQLSDLWRSQATPDQLGIYKRLAEIAEVPFPDCYLWTWTLRYFELLFPRTINSGRTLYDDSISMQKHLKKGKGFFDRPALNPPKYDLIDNFPTYRSCMGWIDDFAVKVDSLSKDNSEVSDLLKWLNANAVDHSRKFYYQGLSKDSVSPFLCLFCMRYEFFPRKIGVRKPPHCGRDKCRRAYERQRKPSKTSNIPDAWKLAFDGKRRRCSRCLRIRKMYTNKLHEGSQLCEKCLREIPPE